MKQFKTTEKVLNGNRYFIRPFPAFVSANLSGEISAIILPVLSSAMQRLPDAVKNGNESILDVDVSVVAPALSNGLSSLSGDKVEALLKKILINHNNISVQLEGERDAKALTEDLANELFCEDVQDMFVLAWEVIRVNYAGFFKKLGSLSGGVLDAFLQKANPS